MAATPQYAVFTFIGMSKRTYTVDAYVSDVANAVVRFDGGGGASTTSPDYWAAPEPCVLTDFAIVTGTQDTTKLDLSINGRPVGGFLRYTMSLTTTSQRPRLSLGMRAGSQFRAIQRA